jgi:hypothetical protein
MTHAEQLAASEFSFYTNKLAGVVGRLLAWYERCVYVDWFTASCLRGAG